MPGGPMPNGGFCPDGQTWDNDAYMCVGSGTTGQGGECDTGFEACGNGCVPIGTCGSTTPGDTGSDCPPGQGRFYPGGPCTGGSQATPGGGEGDGEIPDFSSFFSPYSGPRSFGVNIGNAPRFKFERFQAPDYESIKSDPSYIFRKGEGERAFMNMKAAQGVSRTGGTIKDFLGWNQNFASQEIGNVFDRSARAYDLNYRTALGEWSPTFLEWQTKAQASQRAQELGNQQAFQEWMFGQNMNYNWLQSLLEAGKA